jgi:hypothetical protein
MVRQRYLGILYPHDEFAALRDFHARLLQLQCRCTPLKDDYMAINAILMALRQAAHHFTGDPHFYGGAPGRSFGEDRKE